jgi:hypothetical protein
MKQALNDAVAKKIGYCYVTDGQGANPWGRLPSYWDAEVAAIQKLNAANAP